MNRLRITGQRPQRAVALLLAVICLWISGGMTLGHTDDLGPLLSFHAGTSTLSHAAATDGTSAACLACQWEDSVFDPHLPAVPVLRPSLTLMPLPSALTQTHSPHPFDHTSPRAPSCDLS